MPASLALATCAEVFCSILLVLGQATRFAAVACAITVATAFFTAHAARWPLNERLYVGDHDAFGSLSFASAQEGIFEIVIEERGER